MFRKKSVVVSICYYYIRKQSLQINLESVVVLYVVCQTCVYSVKNERRKSHVTISFIQKVLSLFLLCIYSVAMPTVAQVRKQTGNIGI